MLEKVGNMHGQTESERNGNYNKMLNGKKSWYKKSTVPLLSMAEERINDFEDRKVEINQKWNKMTKKKKKSDEREKSIQELWDDVKPSNTGVSALLQGGEREQGRITPRDNAEINDRQNPTNLKSTENLE